MRKDFFLTVGLVLITVCLLSGLPAGVLERVVSGAVGSDRVDVDGVLSGASKLVFPELARGYK